MKAPHLGVVVGMALGLCACGSDRAAGGSGSETTNTIQARVVDESGAPQAGARVYVRTPSDTLPGTPRFTDGAGIVTLEIAPSEDIPWIEANAPDGRTALRVARVSLTESVRLVVAAPGDLHLEGLAPGASVGLPGLGRRVSADASGNARFSGLPRGAVRIRCAAFEAVTPVIADTAVTLDAARRGEDAPWPVDGSLDSLAIRRFLDLAGLAGIPTDSVSSAIDGRRARLDLHGLGLDRLPEAIGSLSFLRELHIQDNRLAALPSSLSRLPRLSVVVASNNPFGTFPASLQGLDSLRILALDSTRLSLVPSWIGDLSRLWVLDLGHNRLDSLPPRLSDLRNLAILTIPRNRIAALPEGLHRMDSLREIWAETNALRRLPDSVERSPSLKTLQLDNNPLDSLPSRLGDLATLRDLRLGSTPLRTLPVSLSLLPLDRLDLWNVALCSQDPSLEPWLDSLVGTSWRDTRTSSCP